MSKLKNLSSSKKPQKTEVLVTEDNYADLIGKLVVLTGSPPSEPKTPKPKDPPPKVKEDIPAGMITIKF